MIARVKRRWQREPIAEIRQLYFINILRSATFYLPVIIPYYHDVAGVDFAGFLIGEAFFAGAMMVLEVPTGYLSDVWTRRMNLFVSGLFWTMATAYLLVANSLLDVILVQLLMAVGASMASGTVQAMLYEYLAESGRESKFRKVEGLRFSLGFYTLMVTALPAGLLYALDPRLPVVLALVSQIAMTALSFGLREPQRLRRAAEKNPFYDMLKTMHYALYGHREIAAIILMAAVMFSATKLLMWIQQPYYAAAGIPVVWYGVMSAAAFGMIAVSSQLAHKLERWISPVMLMGVLMLVLLGIALLAGNFLLAIFAPLLLVGQAMYGVANPVVSDVISQRAEPERRATILSAQSLLASLFFTILSIPYGWLAEHQGVQVSLLALADVLVVLGLPAWLLLLRQTRISAH